MGSIISLTFEGADDLVKFRADLVEEERKTNHLPIDDKDEMMQNLTKSIALCRLSLPMETRPLHTSGSNMRYKKKWVEMGKRKVMPRELALAYFDTYYPKIYGEKCWEQMRLALTKKKKKYCALVNNYANSQNTVVELLSEHQAYDMFAVTGNPIQAPSYSSLARKKGIGRHQPAVTDKEEIISEDREEEEGNRWEAMSVDLIDTKPLSHSTVYVETDEGFMVPRQEERETETAAHPYHPPDLYDYIPAERIATDKLNIESDLSRQALMLGAHNIVEILPSDCMLVPPMLKCHVHEAGVVQNFHSPKQDETKMLQYYLMDAASVLPVIALDVRPNDRVLDLCAAPGGKSLTIAQCLIADQIVCVDSSWSRLSRLKDTFRWYIPGVLDSDAHVTPPLVVIQDDGRAIGQKHPNRYDKVLVDVPCNTDRHCLTDDDENSIFKRTRVTERLQLPQLQTELLMSGIEACRAGGVIVYSTCTLTPGQNDYVIESAVTQLRHHHPDIEVVVEDTSCIRDNLSHVFMFWSGSRYGQVVLPSAKANFGPSYFAKLLRVK